MMRALVIDDEKQGRETFEMLLADNGFEVSTCSSPSEAKKLFYTNQYQIVLCDIRMPEGGGLALLKEIKRVYGNKSEVIMITGYASVQTAVEAMKTGAFGYYIKGNDPRELLLEIDKAIVKLQPAQEEKQKKGTCGNTTYVVSSNNAKMQKVWELVEVVSKSNANVVITGESGTGKEIIAHQIHTLSARRQQPFIAINCSQYSNTLIESELFGHEKGSFTGALAQRVGKLEQASGGTVFLDEIGDVSEDIQVKLLRVLENRTIERVGSNKPIPIDFRLITATNKSLTEEIRNGKFREDFYYRLNTIEIHIPPLRERREDIPMYISYFINQYTKEIGLPQKPIAAQTMEALQRYDYKGNIRELKNIIERMIILSYDSLEYHLEDFETATQPTEKGNELSNYRDAKHAFEYEYIVKILKICGKNTLRASEMMGISRRQLTNKINELGIDLAAL